MDNFLDAGQARQSQIEMIVVLSDEAIAEGPMAEEEDRYWQSLAWPAPKNSPLQSPQGKD